MTRGGPLTREVFGLAWPAVVQGLLTTLVFMVDRMMLGWYDETALASMQISGPVVWSVVNVFGAFTAGTVAVVGRTVGARREDEVRTVILSVVIFALGLGVLVAALMTASTGFVAQVLAGGPETSEAVRHLSTEYMGVLFPFSPLFLVGAVCMTILQASGDTRTPLLIAALAELVNVAGNWILIFGHYGAPELGVVGAAIASTTAFSLHALVGMLVLWRRRHLARLVWTRLGRPHFDALVRVLKVSAPAFGEKLVFHTGFLVFVGIIGRLGDVAMAANQALIAIESIGFITADGFGVAAGALVAMKLGAEEPADAARAGWIAAGLGVLTLLPVSLAFAGLPEELLGLFTTDPAIIAAAVPCLYVAAVAQPLMASADALSSGLRGAGDTRTPMFIAMVGPVFVRVLGSWALAFPLGLGLIGVWLGSTLDWTVRAIWSAWAFRRGAWKSLEV